MTKSDSQQRIRQVAIVLTCADAATKQRLLGQLPSDQARLVRQEIARLGNVDPRERDRAMKAFQSRSSMSSTGAAPITPRPLGGSNTRHQPSTSHAASTSRGRLPPGNEDADFDDSYYDRENPAAALLEDGYESVHDQVNIEYAALESTGNIREDFEPLRTNSVDVFVTNSGLKGFPPSSGAEIARLLTDERPTVIATVIKQVSTDLGAAILAALPSRIAALALSTLPNLDSVDEAIMNDIHQSLREKLQTFRIQLAPDAPSVQHIQSLLSSVPESQRRLVEQDLILENKSLANSLGISLYANSLKHESINSSASKNGPATSTRFDVVNETFESHDEDSLLTFDDLVDLPDDSLAIVLRAVNPDTILISVTGAAIQMRARLESMIAQSNLSRLRDRIDSLSHVSSEARFAARRDITMRANELLRAGKIDPPKIAYQPLVA